MKKGMKYLLGGLCIVGGVVVGVGVWQWDNLRLLYQVGQFSEEELAIQNAQWQEEAVATLSQYELPPIRDLTEDEKAQVVSGELSIDEVAERLLATEQVEKSSGEGSSDTVQGDGVSGTDEVDGLTDIESVPTMSTTEQGQVTTQEVQGSADRIVATYTAKMYALQTKYTGLLSGLEAKGWVLLDTYTSGAKTLDQLMPQGMALVNEALGLEAECDTLVEDVLDGLTKELEDIGADTDIVSAMRNVYEGEKSAQMSYYIALAKSMIN